MADADKSERRRADKPTSKACDVCHAKRSKCDGQKPCSACLARKKPDECRYDRVQKKRGVPKGTESAVHKRLRQLEDLLKNQIEAQNAVLQAGNILPETPALGWDANLLLHPQPMVPSMTMPAPLAPVANTSLMAGHLGSNFEPPYMVPDLLGTLSFPGPNFQLLSEQISRSMTGASPIHVAQQSTMQAASPPSVLADDMFLDLFPEFSPPSVESAEVGNASISASEQGSFSSQPALPPVKVYPGFEAELSVPAEPTNPALSSLPPDLVQALFQTYFTTCYSLAPIFHVPTFLRTLDAQPAVLLYAMMALAAKSCPHPGADPAALFTKAREELDIELEGGATVELGQALHVLTIYSMASGGLGSLSYIYSALAIRLCMDLGLNSEPYPDNIGFIASETRRRLFWCAYGLDRLQTVAGNRPLAVRDTDCRLRLPVNEVIWQAVLKEEGPVVRCRKEILDRSTPDEVRTVFRGAVKAEGEVLMLESSMLREMAQTVLGWVDSSDPDPAKNPMRTRRHVLDPFTFYIILTNLYGKIHSWQKKTFSATAIETASKLKALDAMLAEWYEALPEFCATIAPDAVFRPRVFFFEPGQEENDSVHSYHTGFMQILYYSVRLILHRPRQLEEMARDAEWLASDSFVRCTESADAIARIVACMVRQEDRRLESMPAPVMFAVFQAAVIELLIVRNLNPRAGEPTVAPLLQAAKDKVDLHIRFLEEMARAWRGEPMLADLLKRLSRDVTLPLATAGPEILQLRGR